MKSEPTKNRVNSQNDVYNLHLEEIKKNNNIPSKIKEYNNYPSNGLPTKKEAYFYSVYTKEKGNPLYCITEKTLIMMPFRFLILT